MHTYFRAAGFHRIRSAGDTEKLLKDAVMRHDRRQIYKTEDGRTCCEFAKLYGPGLGVVVNGEFDQEGNLHPQHMFPFFRGQTVSMKQQIDFEKHSADESYGGICEDPRIGTSIIFHLINAADMIYAEADPRYDGGPLEILFSALAKSGTILLPIYKTPEKEEQVLAKRERYLKLVNDAREGNEEAIEALTEDDMENYNILMKRMQHEDVLSIVDSYFQPYGIECDLYSICGNVLSCDKVRNSYTDEEVWEMQIEACDVYMQVCIAANDLEGEPMPGARFRGKIWLQGYVNFGIGSRERSGEA